MPRIKICGITNKGDAFLCVQEGVDALGFIFYPSSPRSITPRLAQKIVRTLPPFIAKVGVFVNMEEKSVVCIARSVGLDTLQFHGEESPAYCASFTKDYTVIKTIFSNIPNPIQRASTYPVQGVLVDIPLAEKKCFGKTAPVPFLIAIKKSARNLILSGGLQAENVGFFVSRVQPYAVDVARGTEQSSGKKSKAKIRAFVAALRRVYE